jgi:hypothetical protein
LVELAVEFTADLEAPLLSGHPDGAGMRTLVKFIKPASYSAVNPSIPSPEPANKKVEFNLNVTHQTAYAQQIGAQNYSSAKNIASGGSDRYNRNFRTTSRLGNMTPNPNEAFVFIGSKHKNAANARGTSTRITEPDNNSIPSRENTKTASPSYGRPPTQSPSVSRHESPSSYYGTRIVRPMMKGRVLNWNTTDI